MAVPNPSASSPPLEKMVIVSLVSVIIRLKPTVNPKTQSSGFHRQFLGRRVKSRYWFTPFSLHAFPPDLPDTSSAPFTTVNSNSAVLNLLPTISKNMYSSMIISVTENRLEAY